MTSTHETASEAHVPYTDAEKAVYSLTSVEEWRSRQHSVLSGLREASDSFESTEYIDTFNASTDDLLDEYLQEKGISETDPHYDTIRHAFSAASISDMHDDEWYTSAASRGVAGDNSPSGRDKFAADVAAAFADTTTNSTESNAPRNHDPAVVERIETLEAELADVRELWASENAKRQGKLYSTKSKKRESLREEYFAKVRELGQAHLALHDNYSGDDKNIIATTILFDEQEKLRELTTEKLLDTKVSKVIRWMNKGNTATRIAKGVGIGIVAGAAGSFLAGAVGAGIIAGGTVVVTRFARGFALKDKDARGMDSIFGSNNSIDADAQTLDNDAARAVSDGDRMNHVESQMKLNDSFEDDTRREQHKRRKAAGYGTLMIGAGALAGYGIHEIVERASDANLSATHWLNQKFDEYWNGDSTSSNHFEQPGTNHDPSGGNGGNHSIDLDHDGIPDKHDPIIDANHDGIDDVTGHVKFNPEHVPLEARWVEPGEGWYETFQELGIPEDHWADVLKDAGPKLHDQDWAYFDSAHDEWRISQPGRLPNSALQVIADAAQRDGYSLAA